MTKPDYDTSAIQYLVVIYVRVSSFVCLYSGTLCGESYLDSFAVVWRLHMKSIRVVSECGGSLRVVGCWFEEAQPPLQLTPMI